MPAGVEVGTGYITINASAKGAVRQIEREFGGSVGKVGKKAGRTMGAGMAAGMKGLVGPVLALFGAAQIGGFFKEANAEARESQKVGATTTAIIKSTGGAAKITAGQVGELATAISNKTGMDDEAIQKGANLLLTFKNVRNETGKGADIFDRATASAVDLSAAGFGSVENASKMMGKALNDPVKGITALGRAGVTFSDAQKKAIAAMVKSGDVLGAQKIILKEVESQVGGVGAASATSAEKARVGWGNLKEQIGTALLPVLDKFFGFMSTTGIPAMSRLVTLIEKHAAPAFNKIAGGVRAFAAAFRTGMTEDEGTWIENLAISLRQIMPALTPVFTILRNLGPQLKPLAPQFLAIGQAIGGALMVALPIVGRALATIGRILGKVLLAVLPPVGRFLRDDLGPALLGVGGAVQRLGVVVMPIIKAIAAEFMKNWPVIKPVVMDIFHTIGGIVKDVMALIKNIIDRVTKSINAIWARWGTQITAVAGSTFRTLAAIIGGLMKVIGGIIKVVTGVMMGDWSRAGEGIKQIGRGLRQVLVGIFKGARDSLLAVWGGLIEKLKGKLRDGVAAIGRIWQGLQDVAKKPISFVINTVLNDGLIGAFNKIAGFVGANKLDRISIPGFDQGGWTGPGAQMQPAGLVHADEFVFSKRARRAIEGRMPGLLDYMNRNARVPGFDRGGLVGGSGRFSSLFASRLLQAQKLAHTTFRILQRGFRPRTPWSGTSHQGDAVDLRPITTAVITALRSVGIAAWDRTGKGNWAPHIHGVPLPGSGFAAGSAVGQAQSYLHGGDGLGGRDNGPRVAGILPMLAAGFNTVKDWLGKLVSGPLGKLKEITGTAFGSLVSKVPKLIADAMLKKVSGFGGGGIAAPGWSMVGERGRELMYSPGGARVYNHGQTEQMVGRGPTINQYFPTSADPRASAAAASGRVVAALAARGF